MRMMLQIRIPHSTFNQAVRDGTIDQKMKAILDDAQPEAVYFTEIDGHRAAVMIVDLASPSMVPKLAEPWFLTFDADVQFRVVMGPDDLAAAGLDALGDRWG